jgi:WD40 repeat protein
VIEMSKASSKRLSVNGVPSASSGFNRGGLVGTTLSIFFFLGISHQGFAQEVPPLERVLLDSDRVYVGVNFSPDGKTLATSGEGFVQLFDVPEYKKKTRFRLNGLIDEVLFDGKSQVLVARGKNVDTRVFDFPSLTKVGVQVLPGNDRTVRIALAAPDERLDLINLTRRRAGSCPAAFSRDAGWLALSNSADGIRIWDMSDFWKQSRKHYRRVGFYPVKIDRKGYPLTHVNALLFVGDELVLAEESGIVSLLSLRDRENPNDISRMRTFSRVQDERRKGFRHHSGPVTSLCLTSNGSSIISAGTDGKVRAWTLEDLKTKDRPEPMWTAEGSFVAYSPERDLLAVAEKEGVRLYTASSQAPVFWTPATKRSGRVIRLRFSPDGEQLVAIYCPCLGCVPRTRIGLNPGVPKRVHHHGGTLETWSIPVEVPILRRK